MPNAVEIKETQLIRADGAIIAAKFHIWDFDPSDPEMVKLSLVFSGRELTEIASDYYAALRAISLELEKEDIKINCYGASKNAHISGMSLSMGAGEKAFRLQLGEHAKIESLVSIFDSGPDVILSTVEEQDEFFNLWTKNFPRT